MSLQTVVAGWLLLLLILADLNVRPACARSSCGAELRRDMPGLGDCPVPLIVHQLNQRIMLLLVVQLLARYELESSCSCSSVAVINVDN